MVAKEACEYFPVNESSALQYALALLVLRYFHKISPEKYKLVKGYIYLAVLTGKPIDSYSPMCLRYYYDRDGDQQVIGAEQNFEYVQKDKTIKVKRIDDYLAVLLEELTLPLTLELIGIPINIICPIMDHELLRPKRMDTKSNHDKVFELRDYLERELKKVSNGIQVISSLEYFGIPSQSQDFRQITREVTEMEYNSFGIKNSTYKRAVDDEHERNVEDNLRSDYYRSKDFAELCRKYDMGEAFFHARKMSEKAFKNSSSGVIAFLPPGAEFDQSIFNLSKDLVTYS
ncbi:hypothetical protein IT417_00200 [bacterium]|nr:hypothetical protein [bacterium]